MGVSRGLFPKGLLKGDDALGDGSFAFRSLPPLRRLNGAEKSRDPIRKDWSTLWKLSEFSVTYCEVRVSGVCAAIGARSPLNHFDLLRGVIVMSPQFLGISSGVMVTGLPCDDARFGKSARIETGSYLCE